VMGTWQRGHSNVSPARSSPSVKRVLQPGQKTMIATQASAVWGRTIMLTRGGRWRDVEL